jgi:hypothetical protein
MAAAEPVIQAAIEALNSLDKKSLTELKALSSPPAGVDDVTAGVIVSCFVSVFILLQCVHSSECACVCVCIHACVCNTRIMCGLSYMYTYTDI